MLEPTAAGAEVANGLLGEVYRDIKAWHKDVSQSSRENERRRRILASIRPEFAKQDQDSVDLVNYSRWHETDREWSHGKGLICSATYAEFAGLWDNEDRFPKYEANLKRFIRNRGDARRVFVLGASYRKTATKRSLYRVLSRHQKLGFNPRVCTDHDLEELTWGLDLKDCGTVASFNGRYSYFLKYPPDGDPIMARHCDIRLAEAIERDVLALWERATPVSVFLKKRNWDLPDDIEDEIREDIDSVETLSDFQKSEESGSG